MIGWLYNLCFFLFWPTVDREAARPLPTPTNPTSPISSARSFTYESPSAAAEEQQQQQQSEASSSLRRQYSEAERVHHDVNLLNRCFDDVELFVGQLQLAAEAYKELDHRTVSTLRDR